MVARVPGARGVQAVLQALGVEGGVVQLAVVPGPGRHVHFATQDRLHRQVAVGVGGLLAGVHQLHHAEHVAVVGDGHRTHARGPALLYQVGDAGEAVEQGVLGVQVEMGEGHAPLSQGRGPLGEPMRLPHFRPRP